MSYGDYPDLTFVRRVLVIKMRHLGDVLLTTPLFSALQVALPQAQIDGCVYSDCAPVLENHPAIRSLLCVDRRWKKLPFLQRLRKELALLLQIRHNRYDLVIQLTEGDRGAIMARVSGAPVRVGWANSKKSSWFTHLAKNCPGLRHTVERNLDALRRIGIFPEAEARELFFHIPASADKIQIDGAIVIHPASRWRFKCWPVPRMRGLARRLIEQGETLIFVSGPDAEERRMVAEIIEGLDVLDLSGQLSLQELGALLKRSKALICVDSMVLHLTSALKVPVVALFGPTSEVTWGPWRNPHARVVTANLSCRPCYQDGCGGSKRSDCLTAISVDRVLEILKSSGRRGAHSLSLL